jgi:hypothetical protein
MFGRRASPEKTEGASSMELSVIRERHVKISLTARTWRAAVPRSR